MKGILKDIAFLCDWHHSLRTGKQISTFKWLKTDEEGVDAVVGRFKGLRELTHTEARSIETVTAKIMDLPRSAIADEISRTYAVSDSKSGDLLDLEAKAKAFMDISWCY